MEILNAQKTFDKIALMFNQSTKYFYLVSPYFDTSIRLDSLLRNYDYDLNIIVGKDSDKLDYIIASTFEYGNIFFCENLHSKIYLSEDSAIISSMNFYEYSIDNNFETSVFIERSKYPNQWQQIYEQIKVIKKSSKKEW